MDNRWNAGLPEWPESGVMKNGEGNQGVEGITASDLAVCLEDLHGIQKIEIEHRPTRALLYGFMGPSDQMSARFMRVLFVNLARRVTLSGVAAGFIQKIEVPERWQRQGIGSSLLEEVFRRMQGAGIQDVYLDVCPSDESRFQELRSFYERHGFLDAPDCTEDQYPPPFIMKADLRSLA